MRKLNVEEQADDIFGGDEDGGVVFEAAEEEAGDDAQDAGDAAAELEASADVFAKDGDVEIEDEDDLAFEEAFAKLLEEEKAQNIILVDDDEESEEESEEGDDGSDPNAAIQERPSAALLYEKIMPEDRWRKQELEDQANRKTGVSFQGGEDIKDIADLDAISRDMWHLPDDNFAKGVNYQALLKEMDGTTQYDAFKEASEEDRQLYSKVSTKDAQVKAIERVKEERSKPRIGDEVGTGSASPNAYIEIRPRAPFSAPEREAVNAVVSRSLGISEEKASRLIKLGAVWVYEEYYGRSWERIMRPDYVYAHEVLRVFPNPERFKTCYVEDWRDRVKKVDTDFVVVDKPPLLPCFAKVSNGRESLSMCIREALHMRQWGGHANEITDELKPCNEIDDEASGLVVLARHDRAGEVFDDWLIDGDITFEFVALVTGSIEKGKYRHFYNKNQKAPGQIKPALYEEIPPELIQRRQDYDNWDICEMEVLATADLPNNCQAVRIRTHKCGWQERIRAQLSMLGCPVLNDQDIMFRGTQMPEEVARNAGLIDDHTEGDTGPRSALVASAAGSSPLAGAIDEEVMKQPYAKNLRLLPLAKKAAERGVPQNPTKKVPVGLHLARIEFLGRVVTCAPPAYWPEGAAAAVAVKLTEEDILTQIQSFLFTQGGYCRFGKVGGKFGVKADFLEQHFPVERVAGVVFASYKAKKDWEGERRVNTAESSWLAAKTMKRKRYKDMMMRIKETYIPMKDFGKYKAPTFKQIKKAKVKPVSN